VRALAGLPQTTCFATGNMAARSRPADKAAHAPDHQARRAMDAPRFAVADAGQRSRNQGWRKGLPDQPQSKWGAWASAKRARLVFAALPFLPLSFDMIDPAQITSPTARKAAAEGITQRLTNGVAGAAAFAVVYGVAELIRHGVGLQFWSSTYLPLLGGVASVVAVRAHTATFSAPEGARSWTLTAGAAAMLIPYVLSLYLLGFLGGWAIWGAVTAHPLAWGHALAGLFWVWAGWFMVSELGRLQTHLINARTAGFRAGRPADSNSAR
jgi:hypothetical protein